MRILPAPNPPRRPWLAPSLFLASCLALLASCSSTDAPAPEAQGEQAFRIALLTPGSISDGGWNASAWEALQKAKTELGAEIAHIETKTPSEFEEGFRDFASRGFDIVWGHGFEFQDAAAQVGKAFPKTVFLTSTGNTVEENVAPLNFQYEEVTYLQGVLAARMSQSGKLAMVGGVEIPSVKTSYESFKAGALSVRPDAVVTASYIGSWEDAGAAKEAALALIREGVDQLFQNCDAAGAGVFQAARENEGVLVYGTSRDQSGAAPTVVLSSSVVDIPAAFVQVAREIQEKSWHAKKIDLGLRQGVASHILNPVLQEKIPAAVLQEIQELEKKLQSGEVQVKRLY